MKAITICQPYAHLICLPNEDDRAKRVENRKWGTHYRGPLLIHAGKSRDWIDLSMNGDEDETYSIPIAEMTFGAIIGIANLIDCFRMVERPLWWDSSRKGNCIPDDVLRRRPWLACHEHVEGPCCLVLADVRPLLKPVFCSGAQGLWRPNDDLLSIVIDNMP